MKKKNLQVFENVSGKVEGNQTLGKVCRYGRIFHSKGELVLNLNILINEGRFQFSNCSQQSERENKITEKYFHICTLDIKVITFHIPHLNVFRSMFRAQTVPPQSVHSHARFLLILHMLPESNEEE